jgi:hypothetical protein
MECRRFSKLIIMSNREAIRNIIITMIFAMPQLLAGVACQAKKSMMEPIRNAMIEKTAIPEMYASNALT